MQVSNLNLTTEKHGKDNKAPRCDISFTCLLEELDHGELVQCKGNVLKVLWHTDGTPQLKELKKLTLDVKAKGTAKLGLDEDNLAEFDEAVLKSVSVAPLLKTRAELSAQIRVDPTDHLDMLEDLLVSGKGVFSFSGEGVQKDDTQGDLDV